VGFAAQVVFVAGWLVAQVWQGDRYRPLEHTISDMYAVGAPGGWFLVALLTLTGAATIGFAWAAVRPALRPAGRWATWTWLLLALSIFGLGDLLSPFEREGCRLADPGCDAAAQVANLGGTLDGVLSSITLVLFTAGIFVAASALRRTPGWQRWSRPARLAGVVMIVLLFLTVLVPATTGLFERLVAGFGAALVAALAWGVLTRTPRTTDPA
jgi:uncharacterized membrane protein